MLAKSKFPTWNTILTVGRVQGLYFSEGFKVSECKAKTIVKEFIQTLLYLRENDVPPFLMHNTIFRKDKNDESSFVLDMCGLKHNISSFMMNRPYYTIPHFECEF